MGAWTARVRDVFRADLSLFEQGLRQDQRGSVDGGRRQNYGQSPAAIPAVASLFRRDRSGDPCRFDAGQWPGSRVARHGSRGRHREEFEFDRHCTGPNRTATPNDIIARIERYSGIKLAAAFDIPDLDRAVKLHCRYARQNGVHVSPTFMIDGLVQSDMSSGDAVSVWAQRLVDG